MRKSSVVCWLLVILMVALTGAPSGFAEENAAAGKRVAGYYVCFETEEGRIRTELRRGILSLCDGFITKWYIIDLESLSFRLEICLILLRRRYL